MDRLASSSHRLSWEITAWLVHTWIPVVGTGRLSFISATPGGKSLQYQGCLWISGMVILLAGSGTRMWDSRSLHSLDTFTWAGNSYSTFSILCMQAPPISAQISTPLCSFLLNCTILNTRGMPKNHIGACSQLHIHAMELLQKEAVESCRRQGADAMQITWIIFCSFWLSCLSSGRSKGYAPTSITYTMTPHDHMSAICKEHTLRTQQKAKERSSILTPSQSAKASLLGRQTFSGVAQGHSFIRLLGEGSPPCRHMSGPLWS